MPAERVRTTTMHAEWRVSMTRKGIPDMAQTIALVDDDRNILTSVSMALEAEGSSVSTYADGDEALTGLTQTPVDLAVLDIKMPRMDGMELLGKLRKSSRMPVIFLTSKDDEIDEVLETNAEEFVKSYVQKGGQ